MTAAKRVSLERLSLKLASFYALLRLEWLAQTAYHLSRSLEGLTKPAFELPPLPYALTGHKSF